jgi:hypothetical protein
MSFHYIPPFYLCFTPDSRAEHEEKKIFSVSEFKGVQPPRRSEKHSAFSSGPGTGTKRLDDAKDKEAVAFNYRNAVLIPQVILDKKLLFDDRGFSALAVRSKGPGRSGNSVDGVPRDR